MEEKTEAVKSEETTVGLTMNYNPFSFISCQEDLGLKRYRMFQAIAYGETAISVELDLYAKLSAMADKPLVG